MLTACTAITKSYLAFARVLALSLREHDPGSRLYVLLADRLEGAFDLSREPFTLIRLEDLPDPRGLERMAFYYTPFEFCCALRGKLHDYMFERTDAPAWLFLDSDLLVLHSLEEAWRRLEGASILLSPQSSTPAPADEADQIERRFLRYGSYNAGFLGLSRTEEARRFVSWFKDRLERWALFDLSYPMFTDQLWLNLVPVYFKGVAVLDHPGANVAYWNLFERKVTRGPEGWRADGKPLLFYHFSAWSPAEPGRVSRHANAKAPPFWAELAGEYRRRLLAQGWEATAGLPYAFGRFENGERVTEAMRRLYHRDVLEGRAGDGSPFKRWAEFRERADPRGLRPWVRRAARRLADRLSRWVT